MTALKDCELLAPAGDKASFYAAIAHGADAVYLGTSDFSARASAENFSLDELDRYIKYAHFFGVKVYVALNTLVKDNELTGFLDTAAAACAAGADALILQDIFLAEPLRARCPDCVLHLSTQGGVNNVEGARIAKEYGFTRVIPSRETSIRELGKIAEVCETEAFVQGALCTAFSGQCYMSSFAGGSSGNRGRCKQPCRREYTFAGEKCYALSTSDLSVGERIKELAAAGVTSFKIEGRMRRAEYVAAATDYYREIISTGTSSVRKKSALMRTYNRGNYTEGLAFGQNNGFLSRSVQGHIGEFVGKITAIKGNRIAVSGNLDVAKGDYFKILRGMKETGGAIADRSGKSSDFVIVKQGDVRLGDGVGITTDIRLNAALTEEMPRQKIEVRFCASSGEKAVASAAYRGIWVTAETDVELEAASKRGLTEAEVKEVFFKTDEYPYLPSVTAEIHGNVFAPRSVLNALRRKLYAALFDAFGSHKKYPSATVRDTAYEAVRRPSGKLAVMAEDFSFARGDLPFIAIFAPSDYNDDKAFSDFFACASDREKYLYVPALLDTDDVKLVAARLAGFDGIYGENLAAVALARRYGVKLFAGTGFNITNSADVRGIMRVAEHFALSKELSLKESYALGGGFIFARGDIKVMDLGYCPYGKVCERCPARVRDHYTDYAGRKFTLRRVRLASCRFELYNPQILNAAASTEDDRLVSVVLRSASEARDVLTASPEALRERFDVTAGNSRRGVL